VRVLLTNSALENRAGSELWLRDVALALAARGHAPVAFSPRLGGVAAELRRATVPVIDDLSRLAERPDLIHGQHHLATMTALLHFPGVPAIVVCHGFAPSPEAPPAFPRIRRYVAVDDLVRERLVAECGIPADRIVMLRNFVDLSRFLPRPPLPTEPRRALVLSNQAREATFVAPIRSACLARGIQVEVAGVASGNVLDRPEEALAEADVVFAKGRTALEAAAMGCFVVLCDATGLGPALLPAGFPYLRSLNFGARALVDPIDPLEVERRLARYDPIGAAEVRDRIRATAGLDAAADDLIALYERVLDEERELPPPDLAAELRAVSRYLRWGPLRGTRWWAE
jgi:glycosyl transferase family 4